MIQRIVVDMMVNQRVQTCHFFSTILRRNSATDPLEAAIPYRPVSTNSVLDLRALNHYTNTLADSFPHDCFGVVELQAYNICGSLSHAMTDANRYASDVAHKCNL
jgi:hypothetical protein